MPTKSRPSALSRVRVQVELFDNKSTSPDCTAAAAVERYGPAAKCYVAHAKGRLAVGDLAVVIAFGSPHRDEAFRGCREVIDNALVRGFRAAKQWFAEVFSGERVVLVSSGR